MFYIDFIAVDTIAPAQWLSIFSSEPTLEFNLIENQLWQQGELFALHHPEQTLLDWSVLNDATIQKVKMQKYRFQYGFSLIEKSEGNTYIYSFATREKNIVHAYYISKISELYNIGNFCRNRIQQQLQEQSKATTRKLLRVITNPHYKG